jgi:hypothetical protein
MKKILLFSISLVVAVGAFAQGTINFNNNVTGSLKAPIYDLEPGELTVQRRGNTAVGLPVGSQTYHGALLSGTGYVAELWGAAGANAPEGTLAKLASSTFRTGTGAGILFGNLSVAVPGATIDGSDKKGTFQLRAWNVGLSGAAATWADVMNSAVVPHGSSDVFSPPGNLGGTGTPPAVTPNLVGLTSFNLIVVPEPSAIALGVLGLGTLMFLRRRK